MRRLLAPAERRDLTESGLRGTWAWPRETASGVTVTPSSAMTSAAVYACVRIIAETVATLPLHVYRDLQPRGRSKATTHPWYRVLHDRPNPFMSSVSLWDALVGHAILRGTAYAEKVPAPDGTYELWPLRPERMDVERDDRTGFPVYKYRVSDNLAPVVMPRERLFIIPGFGHDGYRGYSPVSLHREAIGLGLALQEHGARLFGNGAKPGGVLQSKDRLSQEAVERMANSWNRAHEGLSNAHRVAILEEGTTWQQVGMTSEDAQFLESRRYQLGEIARIFRVQPHKIGDLTNATFSNIEHQAIEYVVDTIRPWVVRIEAAISLDLVRPESGYSAKFVLDGLLRGDQQSRYAAYSVGRQNGWLSANDVREFEDMNPLPPEIGDVYMVQLNMTPTQMLGQQDGGGANTNASGSRALSPSAESRAAGTPASRQRIAQRYRRLFVDATARLVRREANDVRQAAEHHLNRRDAVTFASWLQDYYQRFGAIATRQLLPVLMAYAEAVLEDAAAEIGSVETMLDELTRFVQGYAESFGEHYAGQSLGQLEALMRDAADQGADPLDLISERLDQWADTRAEKVADRETTRAAGALCVARWRAGGVQRIVWVTSGENCPFCTRLNGKVVGTGQAFATEGEEIEGNETSGPLRVKRSTAHPPIHDACNCGLRPDRG